MQVLTVIVCLFLFFLQEIDVKMHAVKGIGKDHAKFSPVGTFIQQSMVMVRFANVGFKQRRSKRRPISETKSCPFHNVKFISWLNTKREACCKCGTYY